MISSIWDKKYESETLDDLVCTDSVRNKLKSMIDKKDVGVLRLFYGSPGHGKTTATRVIIKSIGCQYKEENCSDKTGIDFIRDVITPFAKTASIDGKKKIVFLDEADRLSPQAMDMLKKLSQEVIDNCSFIFNTNHIERFPEANLSRVDKISMIPKNKEEEIELKKSFFKRAVFILKSEGVKYDSKVLQQHIIKCYPDFRKTIIALQENFNTYGEINENILEYRSGINEKIINMLNSNIEPNEIIEIANTIDPTDFYFSFDEKIAKYIMPQSLPTAYQIFSFYNSSHDKAISKNAHLVACLMELFTSVKSGEIKIKEVKE